MQLDTNKMLDERINYLHQNPVEAGVVCNVEDYIYSSAKDYASQNGLLEIELIE